MAGPAAQAALAVARLAGQRRAASEGDDPRGSGLSVWAIALGLVLPFGLVLALALFSASLGAAQLQACAPGAGPTPAELSGPGSLGGVGGTGISPALVRHVRTVSPHAGRLVTPGRYTASAYGPPWGGIQGEGIATSGGLPINGAAPRWYTIAVSPALISHGTFVYIWPNPFGWKGPFLAADTGGAIVGRRIDFYDWRGRASQLRWGLRDVELSSRPLAATGGGRPNHGVAPVLAGPGSAGCAPEGALELPGERGEVSMAPGADRPGVPTEPVLVAYLERSAGIAGRPLVVTTGSNHGQYTSSGHVSDHWVGMAADLGSVANGFGWNGDGGTRIAAAALRAAGLSERDAWRLASLGGGHNLCFDGWRVQVIWRTGDHYDHVHVGLARGCAHHGVVTFQI